MVGDKLECIIRENERDGGGRGGEEGMGDLKGTNVEGKEFERGEVEKNQEDNNCNGIPLPSSSVLFLIANLLSKAGGEGGPCRRAAKVLAEDLEASGALGTAYDWQGNCRSASLEDVQRRLKLLPDDQLLRLISKGCSNTNGEGEVAVIKGSSDGENEMVVADHPPFDEFYAKPSTKALFHPFPPPVLLNDIKTQLVDLCVRSLRLRVELRQVKSTAIFVEKSLRRKALDGRIISSVSTKAETQNEKEEGGKFAVACLEALPAVDKGEEFPEGQREQKNLEEAGALRRLASLRLRADVELPKEVSDVDRGIHRLKGLLLRYSPLQGNGIDLDHLFLRTGGEVNSLFMQLQSQSVCNRMPRLLCNGTRPYDCVPRLLPSRISELGTKNGHMVWPVYCVKFDRTGHYIITGADDHLVKVWSAVSGALVFTLRGHGNVIMDMAISYDNTLLATASADKVIRVWSLSTGAAIMVSPHDGIVNCSCFSPISNILVSAGDDGVVCVWDLRNTAFCQLEGTPRVSIPIVHHQTGESVNIKSLSMSPLGDCFAAGCSDGIAYIWSFEALLPENEQPARVMNAVVGGDVAPCPSLPRREEGVDANGSNADAGVALLPAQICVRRVARLEGHICGLSDVCFSRVADRLLTGSMEDGTARVWSWGRGFRGMRHVVLMAISQSMTSSDNRGESSNGNGRMLTAGDGAGGAVNEGQPVGSTSRGPRLVLDNVVWTSDDTRIVTSQRNKIPRQGCSTLQRIKIWNSFNGQLLYECGHDQGSSFMTCNSLSPDMLVSAGADGAIHIWDLAKGKISKSFVNILHSGPTGSEHALGDKIANLDVEFSPDGLSFVVGDRLGRWSLYGVGTSMQATQAGCGVPFEQYFETDYNEMIMDTNQNVLDARTQLPTHTSPRGILINAQAAPYPPGIQEHFREKTLRGPSPLSSRDLAASEIRRRSIRRHQRLLLIQHDERGAPKNVPSRRSTLLLPKSTAVSTSQSWQHAQWLQRNRTRQRGDGVATIGSLRRERQQHDLDLDDEDADSTPPSDSAESHASDTSDADVMSYRSSDSEDEDNNFDEEESENSVVGVATRRRNYGGHRLGGDGRRAVNRLHQDSVRRRRRNPRRSQTASYTELDSEAEETPPLDDNDGGETSEDEEEQKSESSDEETCTDGLVPDSFNLCVKAVADEEYDEQVQRQHQRGQQLTASSSSASQGLPRGADTSANEQMDETGEEVGDSDEDNVKLVRRSSLVCALCGLGHTEDTSLPGPLLGLNPLSMGGKRDVWVHDECAGHSPQSCVDSLGNWCNILKEVRRSTMLKCSACKRPGATIGCLVKTCRHNYHFPCAQATGWEFGSITDPFVRHDLFHCKKHRPRNRRKVKAGSTSVGKGGDDSGGVLCAAIPANRPVVRGWIISESHKAGDMYCPQLGDEVIYFPQGHERHLRKIPLCIPVPWSRLPAGVPAVACTVMKLSYGFPSENEYSISTSVVAKVSLKVTGLMNAPPWDEYVSDEQYEDSNSKGDEWATQLHAYECMVQAAADVESWPAPESPIYFDVYLRSCNEPDFLVLREVFALSLQKPVHPGSIVEALFIHCSSEEAVAHRGCIISVVPDEEAGIWSPWECLTISWDANSEGEMDSLCPWEVRLVPDDNEGNVHDEEENRNPSENWISWTSKLSGRLCDSLQNMLHKVSQEDHAIEFRSAVDFIVHPQYSCSIPVPMDLSRVQHRLVNGFYRSLDAFEGDCRLILTNCLAYNQKGSNIALAAHVLWRHLFSEISQIRSEEGLEWVAYPIDEDGEVKVACEPGPSEVAAPVNQNDGDEPDVAVESTADNHASENGERESLSSRDSFSTFFHNNNRRQQQPRKTRQNVVKKTSDSTSYFSLPSQSESFDSDSERYSRQQKRQMKRPRAAVLSQRSRDLNLRNGGASNSHNTTTRRKTRNLRGIIANIDEEKKKRERHLEMAMEASHFGQIRRSPRNISRNNMRGNDHIINIDPAMYIVFLFLK